MNLSTFMCTNKKIKLSIIGSVGLPANYGGWETLVDNIFAAFRKDLNKRYGYST